MRGKNKTVRATEHSCILCGKPAVVFWPVIDHDVPIHPFCRDCVEIEKIKVLAELFKLNSFERKTKKGKHG